MPTVLKHIEVDMHPLPSIVWYPKLYQYLKGESMCKIRLISFLKEHFFVHILCPSYYTYRMLRTFKRIPYSREQKHVSINNTPMLLIEINSISNMGRQK